MNCRDVRHVVEQSAKIGHSGVSRRECRCGVLSGTRGERLDGLRRWWCEEGRGLVGARDARKVAPTLVVGKEPEELVMADRSSGGRSPLPADIGRFVRHADVLALRVQLGKRGEGVRRTPGGIAIVERCLTMQAITVLMIAPPACPYSAEKFEVFTWNS